MDNSFSIVLPAYNREDSIFRSIQSVFSQTHENWELILVNDGSIDGTAEIMKLAKDQDPDRVKIVTHLERQERIASKNDGIKASKNDWICYLDSDDEYTGRYLEYLNDAINQYPQFKIFNFGAIVNWHRHLDEYETTIRPTFKPRVLNDGHENFKSGQIGSGSFIYHRSILNDVPLMIPSMRPYGDPGCFPELNRNPNYPMREDGQWVPMGNPFGDDYHWFWLITRHHISMPLNMNLYIQSVRK